MFWIIKGAATTLGETGGDSVTMTFNWGYLAGTALFFGFLVVLVIAQIVAKKFHPFLYWTTIVASTTFGTTMADFADRSLGIGYTGGSTLLLLCVLVVLGLWYWSEGTISVNTVATPKVECFYWAAITFSQTLVLRSVTGWLTPVSGMKEARLSLRQLWLLSPLFTSGLISRAFCSSGLPLFSPGRLALPSATFWINQSAPAVSTSAGRWLLR